MSVLCWDVGIYPGHSMQTIGHMLDLQEVVCKMMRMIFVIRTAKDLVECRVACLVPLVLESYAIYQMTEYFLKRLVDSTATHNRL